MFTCLRVVYLFLDGTNTSVKRVEISMSSNVDAVRYFDDDQGNEHVQ